VQSVDLCTKQHQPFVKPFHMTKHQGPFRAVDTTGSAGIQNRTQAYWVITNRLIPLRGSRQRSQYEKLQRLAKLANIAT
jgi:hypothetical protein